MKIISVVICGLLFIALVTLLPSGGRAQSYDPRAEVPGASITGVILDANGNSISNATVRLYIDGELFDVPRNPQQSTAAVGRYLFTRLPYGKFLITAEVPDAAGTIHRSNLTVKVDANTVTADIVISDLVIAATPPTTPPPTPYHEPCGLGFVLPVLGLCGLMVCGRIRK